MGPLLSLRGAGYRYPSLPEPSVGPIDLDVSPGELVFLTGATGCGKSTLLRLAAGLLQRHGRGEVFGAITVAGRPPEALPPSERVGLIGFVSQEPSDQIVAGTQGDEIAFGLESAGWTADRIAPRVDELLAALDLPRDPERPALALSGGQRQKLVVAAALAAGARLLLLDEPLSQLDPEAAQDLMRRLRALADEGVAILLVEHRRATVTPYATRTIDLTGCQDLTNNHPPPGQTRCQDLTNNRLPGGAAGCQDLTNNRLPGGAVRCQDLTNNRLPGATVLAGQGLRHAFGDVVALDGVDVDLRRGERVALVGRNGAGKSTLLGLLAGHLPGRVRRAGRVVDVPQDPDLALFCATARDELAYGPREARLPADEVAARVAASAEALSLTDLLDRPPQALSRGQRLRTAVGAALSCRPDALLLDEPTSGQDHEQVERMMLGLRAALADSVLVFATHDLDLARRHATRVLVLEDGRIARRGPPAEVL